MQEIQREFPVMLPIGYTDEAGRIHRQAVLRKMRGHEEALLYDPTLTAGQLITELIRNCLIRLGDLEPVPAKIVSQLYTADRNYLLLELRRITLGDQLLSSYTCPRCGSNVSLTQDLSEVPVRRLDEGQTLADLTLQLEDGYVDREGALHAELVLTLPRGVDEEFVSPVAEKDPLKAQDALLLRCIKRFGSLPRSALEAYGIKILRDLTLGDRQRLHQALNSQSPGVDFQCPVRCGECGTGFEGVMDVTNFFVLS
jgi:predicted RNA-binding Zn-ribbon protein involved in translation (DUF1610 family)